MPAVCSRLRPDAVLLAFLLDLEDGWGAGVSGSGSVDEDGFAIAAASVAHRVVNEHFVHDTPITVDVAQVAKA
eukprot:gene22322-46036_t